MKVAIFAYLWKNTTLNHRCLNEEEILGRCLLVAQASPWAADQLLSQWIAYHFPQYEEEPREEHELHRCPYCDRGYRFIDEVDRCPCGD